MMMDSDGVRDNCESKVSECGEEMQKSGLDESVDVAGTRSHLLPLVWRRGRKGKAGVYGE